MSGIFMDTVEFLALWNARDQWNERATEVFVELMAHGHATPWNKARLYQRPSFPCGGF
jgi:predicted nucleic acid-binding protein